MQWLYVSTTTGDNNYRFISYPTVFTEVYICMCTATIADLSEFWNGNPCPVQWARTDYAINPTTEGVNVAKYSMLWLLVFGLI